jgi:AcrR family transcriptional regulator
MATRTPPLRRRGRRAGRDKGDILAIACAVVAERGADATRFQDVSRATGVPISTLQYSFGSLEDLIIAVFRYNNESDVRLLREETARHEHPWEQLAHLIDLAFGPEDPQAHLQSVTLWMEFWRAALRDDELRDECWAAEEMWCEVLRHTIQRGVDEGVFEPASDVRSAVQVTSALIDGLAMRVRLGESGMDRAGAKRLLLDTLRAMLRL